MTTPAAGPWPTNRIDGIVERQIRDAQERGVFDNLPGTGRPLTHHSGPRDENWWLRQYLLREGVSGVPFLPPALALRKDVEDLPGRLARLPGERQVRAAVTALNVRILAALAKPAEGPSVTLMELDVEYVVVQWRLAAIQAGRSAPATPAPAPAARRPRRRRWLRPRRPDSR